MAGDITPATIPDYVLYPQSEEDIVRILQFVQKNNIALIPFGGGSSVVGGVEMHHNYGNFVLFLFIFTAPPLKKKKGTEQRIT